MRACCGSESRNLIAGECQAALRLGYSAIKLHEITTAAVFAAREAIGAGVPLMVDMNCPLDGAERDRVRPCLPGRARRCSWRSRSGRRRILRRWREVRKEGGLDIAAGENACTAYQFRQMMTAGAVSHAQPSVIKVGGITEFLKVAAAGRRDWASSLIPHSPYFGPGFLATLQLMSVRDEGYIEVFYMKRAACLWRGRIDVDANGSIEVPQGPGLGYEPDQEVMERYRVS